MYTFYRCALRTFLLLRILNSINYDCPCLHFIVAHYYSQYFANFFLQPSLINQGIILHFANIIHLFIDQGFLAFREYRTSIIHWLGPFLHFANIIHLFIDQGFLAFREYHPSFHCTSIFLHFGHWFYLAALMFSFLSWLMRICALILLLLSWFTSQAYMCLTFFDVPF